MIELERAPLLAVEFRRVLFREVLLFVHSATLGARWTQAGGRSMSRVSAASQRELAGVDAGAGSGGSVKDEVLIQAAVRASPSESVTCGDQRSIRRAFSMFTTRRRMLSMSRRSMWTMSTATSTASPIFRASSL